MTSVCVGVYIVSVELGMSPGGESEASGIHLSPC